jgi:hypothetical protein
MHPDVYDVAQANMATTAAGSLQLRDLVETVPTLSTDFTGFVATQENGTQASHQHRHVRRAWLLLVK